MTHSDDDRRQLRWAVYWLFIALSIGGMVGRILAVNSVDYIRLEKDRFDQAVKKRRGELTQKFTADGLSGAALTQQVDQAIAAETPKLREQTRLQRPFLSANDRSRWCTIRSLVEHGTYAIDDIVSQPGWDTIDMVKHKDRHGVPRLYSSKPPLYSTLLAGEYWLIHKLTGATLGSHPYEIGRAMLLINQVLPMLAMFVLMALLVERHGQTDWGRLLVMAATTGGTFLSTFAVTLNNHTPAAVCTAAALYSVSRIWFDGERGRAYFAAAGFFTAFTAVNELTAMAFVAAVTVAIFWKFPRQALVGYLPPLLLVAVAYFVTNYIAHGSWRIPYMHRSDTNADDNWYRYTYDRGGRKNIPSHWTNPTGIDRGEPSAAAYAFHVLIGHHGIFSLTPVWLLSVAGLAMMLLRGDYQTRMLALLVAAVSLACIAFYLARPLEDRNYGGMTSGFRWVFWMAPLWLWGMLPTADATAKSTFWRAVAAVLLAASALSAAYPTWNPWTLPWLHNFAGHMGWVEMP